MKREKQIRKEEGIQKCYESRQIEREKLGEKSNEIPWNNREKRVI